MRKHNKETRATAEGETIGIDFGIDLGDKLSRYCILDEAGIAVEEGSFRNQAALIGKHFGGGCVARVALEVGTQSPWIGGPHAGTHLFAPGPHALPHPSSPAFLPVHGT